MESVISKAAETDNLPWRNSQPCGSHVHHTHRARRIETSQHHSKGSCDQETILPDNKDFGHTPCSSSHQPVSNTRVTSHIIYMHHKVQA